MDNATTSATTRPGEVTQLLANTEPSSGTSLPDAVSIRPDEAINTRNPQEAEDTAPLPHSPITTPQLHTTRETIIRTFYSTQLLANTKPLSGTSSPETEDIRPDEDTSTTNPQEAEDRTPPTHNPAATSELHTFRMPSVGPSTMT